MINRDTNRRLTRSATRRAVLLVLLLLSMSAGIPAQASSPPTLRCTTEVVPVLAGPDVIYRISGRLCRPANAARPPLQVLVHGFTFSRWYWEPEHDPELYSYSAAANAAGYATFAIDRIGVAESSHPPATSVTLESNALALHQVIQWARGGQLDGLRPSFVAVVGHSYGTVVATTEASQFGDVDAVIATGFLHSSANGASQLLTSFWPAQLDPKFRAANLPAGYVTTLPGATSTFFASANTDATIIAEAEARKATGTVTELGTVVPWYDSTHPSAVSVPILVMVGELDQLFCDDQDNPCHDGADLVARERDWYPSTPQLEGYVLPGAGHCVSLERNAADGYRAMITFLDGARRAR